MLAQAGTRREVSDLMGVAVGTVGAVCSGAIEASTEFRARAQEVYGYHPSIFDDYGGGAAPPPPVAPPAQSSDASPAERLEASIEEYMTLLADPRTGGAQRVQLMKGRDMALERLSRVRGEAINEKTLIRHPATARVLRIVFEAIQGHPLALLKVADACHAIEHGDPPGQSFEKIRSMYPKLVADVEAAESKLVEATAGQGGDDIPYADQRFFSMASKAICERIAAKGFQTVLAEMQTIPKPNTHGFVRPWEESDLITLKHGPHSREPVDSGEAAQREALSALWGIPLEDWQVADPARRHENRGKGNK
jgi:hypothetical protein